MQVAIFSFKMDLKMKRLIITVLLLMGIFTVSHAQKLPPGIDRLLEQSRRLLEEFDQDLPLDTAGTRPVEDTSMVMPRIIPVILPAQLFIPPDRLDRYT